MASSFLQLPLELRDEIYLILFNSTRLSYGICFNKVKGTRETLNPARNSLAILQTCRQINAETRRAWLGRVTFRFEDKTAFMEKLSQASQEVVSQIRHICIFDHAIICGGPLHNRTFICVDCHLPTILGLFSLRLDRLTVLRGTCTREANLESFLSKSGWRELRIVVQDGGWGLYRQDEASLKASLVKMGAWQSAIWTRDGFNSGSTVRRYLGPARDQYCILNATHDDITLIDQELIDAIITNSRCNDLLPYIDLRFVIRRGKDVDSRQAANYISQDLESLIDIREEKDRLGWDKIAIRYRVTCQDYWISS